MRASVAGVLRSRAAPVWAGLALVAIGLWLAWRHPTSIAAGTALYDWDFGSLWKYRTLLVSGLGYTLLFTVVCVVLGLAVGLATALGRLSGIPLLAAPLRGYVEVFRCTPVLVQLVWFYYALPVLTGIEMSAAVAATVCLTLYGGAFYSEIIRGGIIATDAGQIDAGRALGLSGPQLLRWVVLPQALRTMLPPLMNQSILQLKNTSLLSVIAVPDLLYQGQVIAHDTYRPLEVYSLIALAYFAVLLPVTLWARTAEFGAGDRRRPVPPGADGTW